MIQCRNMVYAADICPMDFAWKTSIVGIGGASGGLYQKH